MIIKSVWKISLELICLKSKRWVMYNACVSKSIFAIWFWKGIVINKNP